MGRPLGELAVAILKAAEAGPGTAKELAARALVGRAAARYTCSRLCAWGKLQVVEKRQAQGRGRACQVLAVPSAAAAVAPGADLASVLLAWGGPAAVPQAPRSKPRRAAEPDRLAELLAEARATAGNRKHSRGS